MWRKWRRRHNRLLVDMRSVQITVDAPDGTAILGPIDLYDLMLVVKYGGYGVDGFGPYTIAVGSLRVLWEEK